MSDAIFAKRDNAEKIVNSVEAIIEEIRVRIKGNWIAKSVSSLTIDDLLLFDRQDLKLDDLKRRFAVLDAELNDESYVIEIIENVVNLAADARQKKKLDFLAREFASLLQHRGVSREHINESLAEFFFTERQIKSPDDFRIFSQIVYPHHHRFQVIVGVSDIVASLDEDILRQRQMSLIDDEIEDLDFDLLDKFREDCGFDCLLIIFVSATDYNSAVSRAFSNFDSLCNFYRLFSHKEDIQISSVALAEQGCCEGIRKRVEAPENNMYFIRDMRRVKGASTLKRFNELITLDIGPDRIKIQNIINIHGMSLASNSQDIQLVNLWTCLETLAPSDHGSSKIANVVNRVIPVLMLGYYNRLVVNLLFDILRWDRRSFSKVLKSADTGQVFDIKEKFIEILTKKENEASLADLYTRCRDFELLRFRISSMADLLGDLKSAREKLASHENMVRWQLYRIYRTRNQIVHAGESPDFTQYLVENAHDFFDQSLLFCLELSAWKPRFDTFLSCFDYAEAQYREYKSRLKDGNKDDIVWVLPRPKDKSYVFQEPRES